MTIGGLTGRGRLTTDNVMTSMAERAARPRLGVVVPIGSHDRRLGACLASIAALGEVEVAICDGSGDLGVPGTIARSGLKIAYSRYAPDAGQAAAIQEGWDALSNVDVLAWLNVDDLFVRDGVHAALDAFAADPGLDVHFSQSTILDAAGETVCMHPQVRGDLELLKKACTISQPSCFVRRRAVGAVGGLDTSLHYTMDWDLWARLHQNGARFMMGPHFASAVYWGEGTKTSQLNEARIEEILRVTARLSGPVQALKALAGILFHHSFGVRRCSFEPLSGLGEPGASIPVVNAGARSAQRLAVALNGDGARNAPIVPAARAKPAEDGWLFDLDDPVPPGGAAQLQFTGPSPHTLRARWLDADVGRA